MPFYSLPVNAGRRRPKRDERGNMLIFIVVSSFIIIGGIAFFSLGFARLLGSNSEQRTAIEAAALAAARDLSRIAIETPEYGWVSISDAAPVGARTAAFDNFYIPVRSINTIIGTNRLDHIIAEQLNDDWLKEIVKKDMQNALIAQGKLAVELNKSIAPGYVAKDINGNDVEVYKDAEAAYQSNGIRMTGGSAYTAGTLRLSLGGINGGAPTSLKLPKPINMANVPAGAQQNNCYKSYINLPVDGTDYVFAGIGDSIKLFDAKNWVAAVPGLPYQLATVVKAEATQQLNGHEVQGYKTSAVACAQPANVTDPKPCPGALTFSFPDGLCPEVVSPGDMLRHGSFQSAGYNCSYQYADGGDFPVDGIATMRDLDFPYDPTLPLNTGVVFRRALFDWWKRAGTKLNIASAVAMMNDPNYTFKAPKPDVVTWKAPAEVGSRTIYSLGPIPNGNIHIYRVDITTGQVSYQAKQLDPIEIPVAGENQLYSECLSAITKSKVGTLQVGPFEFPNTGVLFDKVFLTDKWDVYIRDFSYQSGGKWGGSHGGEPLDHPKTAMALPAKNFGERDLGSGYLGAKQPPPPAGVPHPYTPPSKGDGIPPAITNQSDLAETANFPRRFYQTYDVGSGIRHTYTQNGMAADIRFRRQVDTGTFSASLGYKTGYVGEKYGDAVPAIELLPYTPPPPTPDPVPTPPPADPVPPADPLPPVDPVPVP